MGAQADRLVGMVDANDRFDTPYEEVRATQVEAANERFQEQVGSIKLLAHQAETSGITEIRNLSDLVPLLFAHTTYKSYPEGWLVGGKWANLKRWLETVSVHAIGDVDFSGVEDLDDWLNRLESAGTYVSCSSGTTGKCSMIAASSEDREFSKKSAASAFAWGTGLPRGSALKIMGTVPVPSSPRNADSKAALVENFGDGNQFDFPGEPITIGQVSRMVALRRKLSDGSATPSELDEYENISAERQAGIDRGISGTIDALLENRTNRMLISGQVGLLFPMVEKIRSMGYSGKDFHPQNIMFLGGGAKGAVLPDDYLETLLDTFNVSFDRLYQYYGMQEINTTMPRCGKGRYHVPPWLILLLLDEHGESLVEPSEGEVEGRAGFFDLSLAGRWGGVISGDKISVRYGACDCGHQGPTVGPDIVRYADLGDGDKITCAGTIDAYIRGVS